jgi:hypothetical protein
MSYRSLLILEVKSNYTLQIIIRGSLKVYSGTLLIDEVKHSILIIGINYSLLHILEMLIHRLWLQHSSVIIWHSWKNHIK